MPRGKRRETKGTDLIEQKSVSYKSVPFDFLFDFLDFDFEKYSVEYFVGYYLQYLQLRSVEYLNGVKLVVVQ